MTLMIVNNPRNYHRTLQFILIKSPIAFLFYKLLFLEVFINYYSFNLFAGLFIHKLFN